MAIKETTFGPKRYLAIRRAISMDDITDKAMYDAAGRKLGSYIKQNKVPIAGSWAVLYFAWDEKTKKAEIGISFPVHGVDKVNDPEFSLVDIPRTKAAMAVLRGPYDGLGETHQALMDHSSERNLEAASPVMAIEEYVVDPASEPNLEKLVTNIYYLHK